MDLQDLTKAILPKSIQEQELKRYSFFLLLDIFFIYISNVNPFPSPPKGNPLFHQPSSCFYEGVPPPTYPLLPPHPGIPLHWDIEPSQDQRPLLPLMPNKAILYYICSLSHGLLHVYSGWWFSPWELWVVWLIDIVVLPMGYKPLQLL